MANLRDVARRASVSITTASRALNGYDDVSDSTRAAVLAAAEALDYHPSAAARSLVSGRSGLVGVQFATPVERVFVSPFISHVVHAFTARVAARGYDILWLTSQAQTLRDVSPVARARRRQVEGLFALDFDPQAPLLSEIARLNVPVVMFDNDWIGPNARFVASDHAEGARLAVRHLAGLGHRDIGLMVAQVGSMAGRERLLGYRQALTELGLAYRPEWVEVRDDYDVDNGHRGMRELLARLCDARRPTAMFVAGDHMAIGAMQAMREAGLSLPGDMSIVGFDDLLGASFVTPALTTIRQDVERIGRTCADLLLDALQDGGVPDVPRVPVALTVRSSTAAPGARAREEVMAQIP